MKDYPLASIFVSYYSDETTFTITRKSVDLEHAVKHTYGAGHISHHSRRRVERFCEAARSYLVGTAPKGLTIWCYGVPTSGVR